MMGNPATFMGNSIAEQNSASISSGIGGSSENSWMNSESGLATGLELAVNKIQGIISAIHSSQWIKDATQKVEDWYKGTSKETKKAFEDASDELYKKFIHPFIGRDSYQSKERSGAGHNF